MIQVYDDDGSVSAQTLYSNDGYTFAPSNKPTCPTGSTFYAAYDPSSASNQIMGACDYYDSTANTETWYSLYTTTNGKDWTPIWSDVAGMDVTDYFQVLKINGSYYGFTSSSVTSMPPYTNTMYKLVNGKWVELPTFDTANKLTSGSVIMYTNGSTLLATVQGSSNATIYQSNDLGITWTQVYNNTNVIDSIYLDFFPALNQFMTEFAVNDAAQGIYSTNGTAWTSFIESNPAIYSGWTIYIDGYNPHFGYLSGNDAAINESQVVYNAPKMVNGNLQFNPLINVPNPPTSATSSGYYVVSSY